MSDRKILIIDDTPTMRMIVTNMLNDLGFADVVEAENADMAFERVQAGDIAIALLDWNLPGRSGIEFLRQIRAFAATRELPIVMMTSNNDPKQIEEARRAGVSSYLVKPFGMPDLLLRMEEASVAHGASVAPTAAKS
ncbi:MAG: response regulator [Bdellovibrionales bacterium]|nr:response regulator [Bdellovibrionales bacterium]